MSVNEETEASPHPPEPEPELPVQVLLIEDESPIARSIEAQLQRIGWEVKICSDGESGLEEALKQEQDVIVLDLILPKLDGLSVCQRLREKQVTTPIVIISARGSELDRINGLELGADDYLAKPFPMLELAARLRAVLRRAQANGADQHVLTQGPMQLDCERRELRLGETAVRLTGKEYALLALFFRYPGRVFSRHGLLDRVWGTANDNYLRNVDATVNRLRQKLLENFGEPCWLQTVYGVGFRFRQP